MNYQVHLCVEHKNTETWVTQTVTVPVTSLCPCSKEISAYGAHNQRSHVTIAAKLKGELSLEKQIRYAEESASCELWSRLKRVDENLSPNRPTRTRNLWKISFVTLPLP